jgi:hypothetical protein
MAVITLAVAALTVAATPAPSPRPSAKAAPAAAATVTTLSPAYYDARYKVIVVPYSGPVPTYTQGSVENPPRVFLDFQARFKGGYPSGTAEGHPNLQKWAMAGRGASTRLTLTFKASTKVRVLHNAKRHLLVLVPQPVAAGSPAPTPSGSPQPGASPKPSAFPSAGPTPGLSPTTLGAPRYDAGRNAVVLPYQGPVPAHITETLANPPRVYFDFEAAYRLRNMPGGTVTGPTALTRWVLSPRDADTTRVTLTFKAPTRVRLRVDEARRELWLEPQSGEAPAATPTAKPSPAASPAPRRTASPLPSPAPRQPVAAPTLEPPRLTPSEKPTPIDSP